MRFCFSRPKRLSRTLLFCMAGLMLCLSGGASADTVLTPAASAPLGVEQQKLVQLQKSQSRDLLESTSSRDVSEATQRLQGQADIYRQFLVRKSELRRQLQEQNAEELKRYESLLLEAAQDGLQIKLKINEDENIAKIKEFAESKLNATNDSIIEFETRLRSEAYRLISAQEEQLRQATLADFRRAELATQLDIKSKLALKSQQLKTLEAERLAAVRPHQTTQPEFQSRGKNIINQRAEMVYTDTNNSQVRGVKPIINHSQDIQNKAAIWTITSFDSTLKSLLLRWSGQAGWSLVWELDVDYPITASKSFKGGFEEAVLQLFKNEQAQSGSPVQVNLYPENKVLRVVGK